MVVHLNDIGTVFRLTVTDGGVIVDLSTTTVKELIFQKPDGTLVTQPATFTTDGTDGQIEYKSISGDIDQVGRWKLQAHVVFGAANDFRSQITHFDVISNTC